jgi:ABC-2 type transport system permease protein
VDVAILRGETNTSTTTFKDGAVAPGFQGILPPLIFLAAFFVVIVFLGNQMLNSTLEEKENRVTEMILTTIKPTSLILGKVVSLFMVGLVQMLVFAIPTILGYLFFRDQLSIPDLNLSNLVFDPQQMIIGALILLGGFSLFTAIFVPFYTVSLVISDPNATIVQIFSFFPYSAPVTALLRNAFGTLPLWAGIVIIVELFALSAIVFRIGVQLFQYGSIEYTRKVSIRNVLMHRQVKAAAPAE